MTVVNSHTPQSNTVDEKYSLIVILIQLITIIEYILYIYIL